MIIKYKFITGEKVEIEVSNDLSNTIVQIESEIKNNDRKETRRHESLSEIQDKADMLIDKSINIEEGFLKKVDSDMLYNALSKLKPGERELIDKLYLDKRPMTQAEYARRKNISETVIWKKVQRIRDKLKKLI